MYRLLSTLELILIASVFTVVYTSSDYSWSRTSALNEPLYQHESRFKEDMDQALERLDETGDNSAHGRILAVNDVHKRYQNEAKGASSAIAVEETIIETNLEQGVKLFEGDIVLDKDDNKQRDEPERHSKRTNSVSDRTKLWKSRIIPYSISPALNKVRPKIQEAVRKLARVTCLRFYEVNGLPRNLNLIYYYSGNGCHSRIGVYHWKKQYQKVSLGFGCHSVGTIIHETMHALGFWHEQSRFDRDRHVKINWENIISGMEDQFERYHHVATDALKVPYDFNSVMHYSRTSFSSNGDPTVVRLDKPDAKLGNNDMSKADILVLNALYDCTNSPAGHRGFSAWTKWTSCSENYDCSSTRERFCIGAPSEYAKKRYCPKANQYGIERQKRKCSPSQCKPIDAGWGPWGKWTDCNTRCGQGKRTRKRACDDPPVPVFGGKKCPDSGTETGICHMGKCNLGYLETQFDGYMGAWSVPPNTAFKWKLADMWMRPGPRFDHTTGKASSKRGMYALARTSFWNQGLERVAKLNSPVMSGDPKCITFFYVIDGESAKALAVRITLTRSKKTWWISYLEEPRGREWNQGMGQIDVPGESVQITFEALGLKKHVEGSIAIDDVYIHSGRCKWPTKPKPTAKPKPASCKDIDKLCNFWAYLGECQKNPKYMLKRCRKSCVCQPIVCKNKNPRCSEWAGKGECVKNKGWMVRNCCPACRARRWIDICKADKNKKCSGWANRGECKKKSSKWMRKNCCKSCSRVNYERPSRN